MRMMSVLDFPGGPTVKDPVQPLVREAPTGCSAAKPVSLSVCSTCALGPKLHSKRSQLSEKPSHGNEELPLRSATREKTVCGSRDPPRPPCPQRRDALGSFLFKHLSSPGSNPETTSQVKIVKLTLGSSKKGKEGREGRQEGQGLNESQLWKPGALGGCVDCSVGRENLDIPSLPSSTVWTLLPGMLI